MTRRKVIPKKPTIIEELFSITKLLIRKINNDSIKTIGTIVTGVVVLYYTNRSNHSESLQAIKQAKDTANIQIHKVDSSAYRGRATLLKAIRHNTIIDSNLDLDFDTVISLLRKKHY